MFSVEERVKMLEEMTKTYANVKIIPFEGLLVDFAHKMLNAKIVIRRTAGNQILNMSYRWRRQIISLRRMLRQFF